MILSCLDEIGCSENISLNRTRKYTGVGKKQYTYIKKLIVCISGKSILGKQIY